MSKSRESEDYINAQGYCRGRGGTTEMGTDSMGLRVEVQSHTLLNINL